MKPFALIHYHTFTYLKVWRLHQEWAQRRSHWCCIGNCKDEKPWHLPRCSSQRANKSGGFLLSDAMLFLHCVRETALCRPVIIQKHSSEFARLVTTKKTLQKTYVIFLQNLRYFLRKRPIEEEEKERTERYWYCPWLVFRYLVAVMMMSINTCLKYISKIQNPSLSRRASLRFLQQFFCWSEVI